MKRLVVIAVLASLVMLLPGSAHAAPDKSGKLNAGTTYTWDGTPKLGANPYYFKQHSAQPDQLGPFSVYTCSAQPYQACETVLLELSNPLTQAEIDAGKTSKTRAATIRLDTFNPAQADFDFVVYASDASGTKRGFFTGAQGSSTSGNNPGVAESKSFEIETTADAPTVWMLLEVVYFAAPNATYKGKVTF